MFYVGGGSTLKYAQQMMAGLHVIINHLKQHFKLPKVRLLDVPCGDMQWMGHFLQNRDDIVYTGIDIVSDLIKHHRETYANRPWAFYEMDIVADSTFVNNYDLIISRHMMQHLDNAAVFSILKKLSDDTQHPSFLLATTHSNTPTNIELNIHLPGRGRPLNLELAPFRLGPPLCMLADGDHHKRPHYAGLWRLPLMAIPKSFCSQSKPAIFFTQLSAKEFYSCVSWGLPNITRIL